MRRALAQVSIAFACVSFARAQVCGPWQVLGRFESDFDAGSTLAPTPAEKLLADMLPEEAGPDLGLTYKGFGGELIGWRALGGKQAGTALDVGVIDLHLAAPPPAKASPDNAICYLYRRIDAPEDSQLAVTMGSDDGLRAWLNGELIVDAHVLRVLDVRDNFVVLRLHAGTNHLFVKVTNKGGGFTYRLAPWTQVSPDAVNTAIDRGVEFLLQSQLLDGSWGCHEAFGGGHAAFSAYTLLKCGVRADHPAVQMAFAAATHRPLETTYAVSSQVLALAATGDASARERIEQHCRELVDLQDGTGLYAYPLYPTDQSDRPVDLSCTLFAALALHAATQVGVETPHTVWRKLASGTLRCLERAHDSALPGQGPASIAGFSYRVGEGATGSMTTAGLSVLALAEAAAGLGIPISLRDEITRARELGLSWMARHLTWTTNPGAGAGHHYFWIYGVERAGALLERDKFGAVDWYSDGAAYLLQAQKADGSWSGGAEDADNMDTLLALLFLKRATRQRVTGESTKAGKVAETRQANAEVALRATGSSPLTVWVTELRGPAIDAAGGSALEIEKIEYFARRVDERGEAELLASVPVGKAKPTELARFALRHSFTRSGAWLLSARVWLLAPASAVLVSPELEVRVDAALAPGRLDCASDTWRNLLRGTNAKSTASTSLDGQPAANAIDGRLATRWQCAVDEREPWIRVTLDRPLKADRVVLSHAQPRAVFAGAARVSRVEVLVNGKERFAAELSPDVLMKTAVGFGQTLAVKQLEVRVLGSANREVGKHAIGFSEVELRRGL